MSPPNRKENPSPSPLGELLRQWRGARGKSQLDLSLDTGVSQRHISFIESGRSTPGRQTLMDLAEVLDVPLRERNALLLAAGYAPIYSEAAWNSEEMQHVNKALERILQHHNPYPAVVMDRYWNVFMANQSALQFFNRFIDMDARKGPRNILHLMFDPEGMRPFIIGWERVAKSLLQRVLRESAGRVTDDATKALVAALLAYPEVESEWQKPLLGMDANDILPVIPLSFAKNGLIFNYFSMVSTVGTPQTVAAQELRVECLFPADDLTERHHDWLMASAQTPTAG